MTPHKSQVDSIQCDSAHIFAITGNSGIHNYSNIGANNISAYNLKSVR